MSDELSARQQADQTAAQTLVIGMLDELKSQVATDRRHAWLWLHENEGWTYPQLAERCAVSVKTVNQALALARRERDDQGDE